MNTDALININAGQVPTVEIIFLMTILMLLPSAIVMMTSFVRIIIVLSFTRNALASPQVPPNIVLVGLALFLTLFIMSPVIEDIEQKAYIPYTEGTLTTEQMIDAAIVPLKEFMLKHTEIDTLNMFIDMSDMSDEPVPVEELPLHIVVPSFMTSELQRAFVAGLLIFIPFLLIDIIVSSTLMSMGMIMLPPATIALPFKLLLFVSINGWELLFQTLIVSFNT